MVIELCFTIGLFMLVLMHRYLEVFGGPQGQSVAGKAGARSGLVRLSYIGPHLTLAAASVVALLLHYEREWVSVIMICYLILCIFAMTIDMVFSKYGAMARCTVHTFVTIIVLVCTFAVFAHLHQDAVVLAGQGGAARDAPGQEVELRYRVAIPYLDKTAEHHNGRRKWDERRFVFVVVVSAISVGGAVEMALRKFREKANTAPMYGSRYHFADPIKIEYDAITVEILANKLA